MKDILKSECYDFSNLTDIKCNEKESILKHEQTFQENDHKNNINNNQNATLDTKRHFKLSEFTRRQKWTLIINAVGMIITSMGQATPITIFPQEAELKGMSGTFIGLVFGIYPIAMTIFTPIVGSCISRIKPKFIFVSGVFILGSFNILFGFVTQIQNSAHFTVICLVTCFVGGIGHSAFLTTSFAIISSEFHQSVSFSLGILETASEIGFVLGPPLAGFLYGVGGFPLPFVFIGCLMLILAAIMSICISIPNEIETQRKRSIFYLQRCPLISIAIFCNFIETFCIKAFDITISKILEPFHFSATVVGLIFSIVPFCSAIFCTLTGYWIETKGGQFTMLTCSMALYGVGLLIQGPSSLFSFIPINLPIICVALVIMGVCYGVIFVTSYKCVIQGAIEFGFENNLDTAGLCSGLFNTYFNLGSFVGPVVMGSVVQHYGLAVAYSVLGVICIVTTCIISVYFGVRYVLSLKKSQ